MLPRSAWKLPFLRKILVSTRSEEAEEVTTRRRDSMISPVFVNKIFHVYNGRAFIPVTIRADMIGRKLGEFALTKIAARTKAQRLKKLGKVTRKTTRKLQKLEKAKAKN